MHGIPKSVRNEANIVKLQAKNEAYVNIADDLLRRYRQSDFAVDNLQDLNKALVFAPLDYTLWNYRRDIVDHNMTGEVLKGELAFIEKALNINAKIYSVWEYRRLIIQRLHARGEFDLESEKVFLAKILKDDARNFHCWNYRRQIAQLTTGKQCFEKDLEDTADLIRADFSNYSAFYHRFLCLRQEENQELERKEMEFVQKCIFIAPNDQSLWTYFTLLCKPEDLDFVRDLIQTLDEDEIQPYIFFAKCCLDLQLPSLYTEAITYLNRISDSLRSPLIQLLKSQLTEMEC